MTKLSDFPASSTAPALADALVGVTAANVDTRFPFSLMTQLRLSTKTASYTLVAADANSWIEMNVASANNLTIPTNASVPFPIGTIVTVVQIGAGQTSFVASGGVTIDSAGGALSIVSRYNSASLYKRATNEWVLMGGII